MKKSTKTITWVVVIAIVLVSVYMLAGGNASGAELEEFSKCLTDSGVKMFGAYWCPHCKNQKKMFGSSWDNVDYVECSLPDGVGQTQACISAGIKGYPTWEFNDGSRVEGEASLKTLSDKTGCILPA